MNMHNLTWKGIRRTEAPVHLFPGDRALPALCGVFPLTNDRDLDIPDRRCPVCAGVLRSIQTKADIRRENERQHALRALKGDAA